MCAHKIEVIKGKKPRRSLGIPLSVISLVLMIVCMRCAQGFFRPYMLEYGGVSYKILAVLIGLYLFACIVCVRFKITVNKSLRAAAVIFAVICCSFISAYNSLDQQECARRASLTSPVSTWTISVLSDPSPSSARADLWTCTASYTTQDGISGRAWMQIPEEVSRGDVLRVTGCARDLGNSGWSDTMRCRGISCSIKATRLLSRESASGITGSIYSIRNYLIQSIQPESSLGHALLAGCVAGWRRELKAEHLDKVFAGVGMAHLIAVSGAHLSYAGALFGRVARTLSLRLRVRCVLLLCLMATFVILCGSPVSALRAWAMNAASYIGLVAGRQNHGLSGLGVAGCLFVVCDPTLAFDVGFLLSVTSVAALLIGATPVTQATLNAVTARLMRPKGHPSKLRMSAVKILRMIIPAFIASLIAQSACLPLSISIFGTIALIGPFVNVIAAPLFTLVMVGGLVAVFFTLIPILGSALSTFVWSCAALPCTLLIYLAENAMRIPYASIPLNVQPLMWAVAIAVACVVAFMMKYFHGGMQRALVAIALCVLLVIGTVVRESPSRVVVLDIGQGDAILVQHRGKSLLVDAGVDGKVVSALARKGVGWLDAVIITHLHEDHYGGLDDLVGKVGVGTVYVGSGVAAGLPRKIKNVVMLLTGKPAEELAYHDEVWLEDSVLRTVWPQIPTDGRENAMSLCFSLRMARDDATLSAYLTGDAERDETRTVLQANDIGNVDLLKVGHHGAAVSIDQESAHALSAEVAAASAGENNRYGHPKAECIGILQNSGSLFLCTKDVGDIEVQPGKSGPVITTSVPWDTES